MGSPFKLKFANHFIIYQKRPFGPGRLHSELWAWGVNLTFKLTLSSAISKKLPKSIPGSPVHPNVGRLPVLMASTIYLLAASRHIFVRAMVSLTKIRRLCGNMFSTSKLLEYVKPPFFQINEINKCSCIFIIQL